MLTRNSSAGFSLIELLVIVTIIGILVVGGTVGYGYYVESTKQSLKQDELRNFVKAVRADVKSANMKLGAFSEASPGLQGNGKCLDHAIAAVRGANKLYENYFNISNQVAIYGPSLEDQNPRIGEIMIYCSDPTQKISSTNLLRFCVCFEEPCEFNPIENCPKTW